MIWSEGVVSSVTAPWVRVIDWPIHSADVLSVNVPTGAVSAAASERALGVDFAVTGLDVVSAAVADSGASSATVLAPGVRPSTRDASADGRRWVTPGWPGSAEAGLATRPPPATSAPLTAKTSSGREIREFI